MSTKKNSISIHQQVQIIRSLLPVRNQPIIRAAIHQLALEDDQPEQLDEALSANAPKFQPTMAQAIQARLPEPPTKFNTNDVLKHLVDERFPFKAKDRRSAVGAALRQLVERGVIQELDHGKGGKPSVFCKATR